MFELPIPTQGTLCLVGALLAFAVMAFFALLVCVGAWIDAARKYEDILERCEALIEERDDAHRARDIYVMARRAARATGNPASDMDNATELQEHAL